jgi:hypothetical protein
MDHFAVSIQLGHTDGGALVMARYGHPSEDKGAKAATRCLPASTRPKLVAELVAALLQGRMGMRDDGAFQHIVRL